MLESIYALLASKVNLIFSHSEVGSIPLTRYLSQISSFHKRQQKRARHWQYQIVTVQSRSCYGTIYKASDTQVIIGLIRNTFGIGSTDFCTISDRLHDKHEIIIDENTP